MAKIRVRARAVDMLGRQQIAGIPTAVHELFKNAHDAYAERVRVDYYRSDELLILRDDGLGMTRDDFETRWLTLGTESKVGANEPGRADWTGPRGAPTRPITGEKGIGRLAIAAIGPQVLILTRAVRPEGLQPVVVSLIHWGLFEVPGLELDAIEIPIEEMEVDQIPDLWTLKRLASKIRENVHLLSDRIDPITQQRLLDELALADFDPGSLYEELQGPSFSSGGYGTHFFIRPTSTVLADDIDASEDEGTEATPLEKMLLGFGNTMMPDGAPPPISAEFWDHREDGVSRNIIGDSVFFTPEEFKSADHHIDGSFDEFGQFSGTVSIYGQEPRPHVISWPGASGRATECGPFRLRFGYVQGSLRDSRLPPDEWAALSAKLNRIGGLYVYRDGIRILPYGNSDFDFLGIERRRTKSAQDWFFSYRRMLGAVELTHSKNKQLVEKAGREGFRTNRAYREFVSMLENAFQRLAIDFFRPTSQLGDEFASVRTVLNEEAKILKKRAKQTRVRRGEFKTELEHFFEKVEQGEPSHEAAIIQKMMENRLEVISTITDDKVAAEALLGLEVESRTAIDGLERAITVARPRGVGLTKSLNADWAAYQLNAERIRREVIEPVKRNIELQIEKAAQSRKFQLDRRRRLTSLLEQRRASGQAESNRIKRQVQENTAMLGRTVHEMLRHSTDRFQAALEATFADLGRLDVASLSDTELYGLQHRLEERLDSAVLNHNEFLSALRDQLVSLAGAVSTETTLDLTTAALETEAEALRDQLELYAELAQAGMAVGIVQHEFGNTVRTIRRAITQLEPWAEETPGLEDIYHTLHEGFDHLDGYLSLFTPLSRRLNRTPIDLSGEEIRNYLLEVFATRLEASGIQLQATPRFLDRVVRALPSTLLATFVNVVDNAVYWIGSDPKSIPEIVLDTDEDAFLITNGGPGIPKRIADRIFEFGETMKPGGRGMGLYLSRQALRSQGLDLELRVAGESEWPIFAISQQRDDPRN